MLNRPVYLLVLLIEECAEVIQRACKAIRFGLKERQGEIDKTGTQLDYPSNDERLWNEMTDLLTVKYLLQREGILPPHLSAEVSTEKIKKIERYYRYSVSLGRAAKLEVHSIGSSDKPSV